MTKTSFLALPRGWTLSRITTIYFATGVISLIAVCIVTYRALTSFADTAVRVARTHQVQAEIGHLQRSIIEAVAARKVYAATGAQTQLAAVRATAIRARDHLTALAQLTQDNLQQKDAIDELQRLLVGQLAKAAELANPPVETPPAPRGSGSSTGQGTSELLVTLLGRISDEEQKLLQGREERARHEFELARTVVPTGTIASVLLLTGAVVMLNREAGERKRAENALRQLNTALDSRVRERTTQLEDALKELEAFSYSVSHDLRAPLRHVQGYSAMLEREIDGQLTDSARRYLNTISSSCVEMGQLIDDLLGFSRMGRLELSKSCVPLDELVGETLRGLESSTQGRNIVWKIAPLPSVFGDASMLRRVFDNLIGNAIKYTRPRNPAEIEVGCAGEEDGRVIVVVRDNGAGFDMKYVQKLFGVFQRLHRADEFEGTGIGLAIVRRVVSRHGGRVWAESDIGRGAAFYLTLQRARKEPDPANFP